MEASDITGVEISTARRVMAAARGIAPSIDALPHSPAMDEAVAILQAVAAELPKPGQRRVRSQSRNGTAVSLDPFESAFTAEERAALRSLCGDPPLAQYSAPVGTFPEAGLVESVWPEGGRPL